MFLVEHELQHFRETFFYLFRLEKGNTAICFNSLLMILLYLKQEPATSTQRLLHNAGLNAHIGNADLGEQLTKYNQSSRGITYIPQPMHCGWSRVLRSPKLDFAGSPNILRYATAVQYLSPSYRGIESWFG
ncbi:hypothetical protein TNCV_2845951 [Trichonephila clavipes]|nr:hypothetical protein TNCV_2845951 [Trichonephila clavipes]